MIDFVLRAQADMGSLGVPINYILVFFVFKWLARFMFSEPDCMYIYCKVFTPHHAVWSLTFTWRYHCSMFNFDRSAFSWVKLKFVFTLCRELCAGVFWQTKELQISLYMCIVWKCMYVYTYINQCWLQMCIDNYKCNILCISCMLALCADSVCIHMTYTIDVHMSAQTGLGLRRCNLLRQDLLWCFFFRANHSRRCLSIIPFPMV